VNYCTTHEGEIEPCKICAAIERNKKLRGEVEQARAAMPAGMLDGPGDPPLLAEAVLNLKTDSPFVVVKNPAPADPLVLRAQAYVDAQKAEKAIEDKLEELENSIESYKIALEQARGRTILAKQMLTTTLETP